MADAYLALHSPGRDGGQVLMGQKNIYEPPCGKYQFATIAHNAAQYVLPGGFIQPGEQPADAAVRGFYESTGVKIPASRLQPLLSEPGEYTFFQVQLQPGELNLGAVNDALANGQTGAQRFNNFIWTSLDDAPCRLGNKESYQALPWVSEQIVRALSAGFSREIINLRANESSVPFVRALAQLILDVLGPQKPAPAPAPVPVPASTSAEGSASAAPSAG